MAANSFNDKTDYTDFETYYLIWLDAFVNKSSDNSKAQIRLRRLITNFITFEEEEDCIKYAENLPTDDRIILIASGKCGRSIVPIIHSMPKITSIFIYCADKRYNEQWARHYSKVKAVTIELNELVKLIDNEYQRLQQTELHEVLPIKLFNKDQSTDLYKDFINSQLLIDCVIRMAPQPTSKDESLEFFNQYYSKNLLNVSYASTLFDECASKQALSCYVEPTPISQLLNKAFRKQKIDLICLLQFVIYEIGCELGANLCSSETRAYRCQLMSNEELDLFRNSEGCFISIDKFLLANRNRETIENILNNDKTPSDMNNVLIEIIADPHLSNTRSFGIIKPYDDCIPFNDILFMVGSIFRIEKMEKTTNEIFILQLRLSSLNDESLKPVFERIKTDLAYGKTNLIQFSRILLRIGKLDEAKRYCCRYLNQLSDDHPDISECYSILGAITESKKEYPSSLKWYNKSLNMYKIISEHNDENLANLYNTIANIYLKLGEYKESTKSYKKALIILESIHDTNDMRIAKCQQNVGVVYEMRKNYGKALYYYENVLNIFRHILPKRHIDRAKIYGDIAYIHELTEKYDMALTYYQKAMKIYKNQISEHEIYLKETNNNILRIQSKLEQ